MNLEANYHSFLGVTKDKLDPILAKMREQDEGRWSVIAWTAPLKKFPSIIKPASALSKITLTTLPIIGPAAAVVLGILQNWPVWIIVSIAIAVVIVVYYILVRQYINKMISIASPEFHIGALKAKRPNEYELWKPIINFNASFSSVYDFINATMNSNDVQAIKEALDFFKGQSDVMKDDKDSQDLAISYLEGEIEKHEKAISYLVGLIKDTNKSLFRLVNDCMNFQELDFVCSYTIYEIRNDMLVKIVDKGTTGRSPMELEITKDNADVYSVVDVAMNPHEVKYNNPHPGRTVLSTYMKMENGRDWIYNFHFDESNDKALYLALGGDIIEIKEVYRLIHAFCLILQKTSLSGKEGTLNVDAVSDGR